MLPVQRPESVENDPAGDRYFVSNTSDGTIKQRDRLGTVTPSPAWSHPLWLESSAIRSMPAMGQREGYLLSTGALVSNLNLGGAFLNGITTDGTYLYVTDFSDEKIFPVDPPRTPSSPGWPRTVPRTASPTMPPRPARPSRSGATTLR
ncbi:MAG: hypothetical protein IPH53_11915 [Flavobacteriales bacterium]|nr:hypothetical protein [Flavobacteriales bacterium]